MNQLLLDLYGRAALKIADDLYSKARASGRDLDRHGLRRRAIKELQDVAEHYQGAATEFEATALPVIRAALLELVRPDQAVGNALADLSDTELRGCLTPLQRHMFLMRYADGLSDAEIAAACVIEPRLGDDRSRPMGVADVEAAFDKIFGALNLYAETKARARSDQQERTRIALEAVRREGEASLLAQERAAKPRRKKDPRRCGSRALGFEMTPELERMMNKNSWSKGGRP